MVGRRENAGNIGLQISGFVGCILISSAVHFCTAVIVNDITDQVNILANLAKTWGSCFSPLNLPKNCSSTPVSNGLICSANQIVGIDSELLSCSDAKIDASSLSSLTSLASLRSLNLAGTNITGELEDSLSILTKLTHLDLSTNFIYGSIPSGIASITGLEKLDLSNNFLTGSIPDSFSNLKHLSSLSLAQNIIDGGIPSFLVQLANLTNINLFGNYLTGSIPSVLSQLSYLGAFSVSCNNLTGPIPANLSSFPPSSFSSNLLCGDPLSACDANNLPKEGSTSVSCNRNTDEKRTRLYCKLFGTSCSKNGGHGSQNGFNIWASVFLAAVTSFVVLAKLF